MYNQECITCDVAYASFHFLNYNNYNNGDTSKKVNVILLNEQINFKHFEQKHYNN